MSAFVLVALILLQPSTATESHLRSRAQALAAMQRVMGALPKHLASPVDFLVHAEETVGDVVRKKISYAAGKDDRVTGYLLIPKESTPRRPAMLCLHQTTKIGSAEPAGLGPKKNLHYALELAQRGYVTFAPDYPNFGEYKFDPYANGYLSATMKGIVNHRRAVDVLQSLPDVDPNRIGVIGHSLGGHNALFIAAFDERLRVAVTSCGFTSFAKYMKGDLAGWSHKGYMPMIATKFGKDPKRMPFDFPDVLAAIAPRAVFINAPLHDDNFDVAGVKDCVQVLEPTYRELGAPDRLVAVYPDASHDFPPEVRKQAYAFIDRALNHKESSK